MKKRNYVPCLGIDFSSFMDLVIAKWFSALLLCLSSAEPMKELSLPVLEEPFQDLGNYLPGGRGGFVAPPEFLNEGRGLKITQEWEENCPRMPGGVVCALQTL